MIENMENIYQLPDSNEPPNDPPKSNTAKKLLFRIMVALGCIAFFVVAFFVTTNILSPKQTLPVHDGKAIIQEVEINNEGCSVTVLLDGDTISIDDTDRTACEGLEKGMDITQQLIGSN